MDLLVRARVVQIQKTVHLRLVRLAQVEPWSLMLQRIA